MAQNIGTGVVEEKLQRSFELVRADTIKLKNGIKIMAMCYTGAFLLVIAMMYGLA